MFCGGSSHNFGLTVRGSKLFYDGNWSEYLDRSYEELVQYFKKIENYKCKRNRWTINCFPSSYQNKFCWPRVILYEEQS